MPKLLLAKEGFISRWLVRQSAEVPCESVYIRRFGSVDAACAKIPYERPRAYRQHVDPDGFKRDVIISRLKDLLEEKGYLSLPDVRASPRLPSLNIGQVQTLHRLVRRGLTSALSGSPRIGGGFVSAEVRLTWGFQPRDLDLHVRRTGNEDESVHYGQLTAPWLQHHGDVTTGRGPELVTIDDPEGAFIVTVRQYTPDGTLGDSGARIEIRGKAQDGREVRFTFEPPADLAGPEWPVARLDMALGSVVGAGGGDITS